MQIPSTLPEALKCITTETARMSYPASMSRGKKPVVAGGTKELVQDHLVASFPIANIWSSQSCIFTAFDLWHTGLVDSLAIAITSKILSGNNPRSVAAKFINTFLHQLTKYEEARPLVPLLHLPLDTRVFTKLRTLKSPALQQYKKQLNQSPYSLDYDVHQKIQSALLELIKELNERPGATYNFSSRIELNWLWL
jgi:hypothetical protein